MPNPIKVVVIGAGNMGSSHARAYSKNPGFELVAIIDQSEDKRANLANELGRIGQFGSLNAAIEKHSPDAIAICTYPDTHYTYVLKSLEAGAHVFVEKVKRNP